MVELDVLRRFPYFEDLSEQNLKELAAITRQRTIPAGTVMFREGDPANQLYVIVRGKVEIQYPLGGERLLSIQTLRDGDLLVWSSILEPHRCKAQGRTLEDLIVLEIDAERLRESFVTDPILAQALLHQIAKMLAGRLQNARRKFARLCQSLEDILARSREEEPAAA